MAATDTWPGKAKTKMAATDTWPGKAKTKMAEKKTGSQTGKKPKWRRETRGL